MNNTDINNGNEVVFEDISSSTTAYKYKEKVEKVVKAVDDYGEGAFKHIDKIIKVRQYIYADFCWCFDFRCYFFFNCFVLNLWLRSYYYPK